MDALPRCIKHHASLAWPSICSVFMQDSLQRITENVNNLYNVNTTYLFFRIHYKIQIALSPDLIGFDLVCLPLPRVAT